MAKEFTIVICSQDNCQRSCKPQVAAMQAVEKEELTISAAAAKFKVPRKILDDRLKGRVQHGTAPSPSTVLTAEEEDAFSHTLSTWHSMGSHLHIQ